LNFQYTKKVENRKFLTFFSIIKERILIAKPTNYGLEISINSEEREKILYYIDKFHDQ